jgi:Zn-dependent M28 family amino/carboxypeptidase
LLEGKNIIVTFHGRNRGTLSDNILLVGAHYDSENSMLQSVNDNGSGMVAMLECVRNLVDAIVNQRLELLNSVIFVAFDVQRSQYVMLWKMV